MSAPLSGSRPLAGIREKRRSVAQEAFFAMEQGECGAPLQQLPDAPAGAGDIQRRWLAEQRDNLLEELYPNGSPSAAFTRTPARGDPLAGLGLAPSAEVTPANREVCNLSTMFENAEDCDIAGAAAAAPSRIPAPPPLHSAEAQQRRAMREARKSDFCQ